MHNVCSHLASKLFENLAGIELEVSSLLASVHRARWCYAGYWESKSIYALSQL